MLSINFTRAAILMTMMLLSAVRANADPIDDYVRDEMARQKIPGLSLAVVRGGEVVKLAAYGSADLENDVAVTPRTVFQIQSVTKTMTSASIMLLADEGKLSIDDLISKHLAGTPDTWRDITLRHLLTHTSGVKDFINEPTVSLRLEVTEEEVLRTTAPRPLNFPPGEKYAYCNTGYHLLAMVIRKITNMPYGEFLAERFFIPLGMKQTRLMSWSDLIPHRATGYALENDKLRRGSFIAESVLAYGGGGVVSTAADMAIWAKALAAGKVIKKELLDQCWTPATFNDGNKSGYGLGWRIAPANGHRAVSHGGAHSTGFTSHLVHHPDDGLSVVVLTNAQHGFPSRIARRVAGLIEPALVPQAAKPTEDGNPELTAKVKNLFIAMADDKLDTSAFAEELGKTLSQEPAVRIVLARSRGELRSMQLVDQTETSGAKKMTYYAVTAAGPVRVTVGVAADGKIVSWLSEDE